VYPASCNTDFDPADEPITTAESLWIDLEAHVRERALRILSDLCYAYITTAEVDSALDNNDSEFDPGEQGRITSNLS
jgi:hypothetical protein